MLFALIVEFLENFLVQLTLFCKVTSSNLFSTIAFDTETKVLHTEIFRHHTIADLNSAITFVFSQQNLLW